ncbi:HelD family protein [Streptomyces xiamenensis]|uniref:HelD family protein n=1 Tax=Streptomyces TaxID=1883 RepID=UPI0005BAFF63|nr:MULTISPECIES: UvrD-helicase domain-containing protein [unclassified Streptomyces]QQN77436.1 UvrD-helicase domain-containing protein [Streptomyces sp. XC 2026]
MDVREREVLGEQRHLDTVYGRLEEKIHEAEFLMADAAKRVQVGTPGALAERDAQVFQAGMHLSRLNNEFEDFLFGRIDLLAGQDGRRGPDGALTSVDPAEDAVRPGPDGEPAAEIAETLHIGRLGVLDAEYVPLVIDWRAPAAAPFYRATPVAPGRVVRRRVIRSKGRRVLGVEDDLLRPELRATLAGEELPVVGDGALMAALGRTRGHRMTDIVASIQAEQDEVIRAPAVSVTEVTGGPGTGKTAVALHRAAYLLYQDRRRYAGGILIVSPTPLLVSYTEGVLPALGEEGQVVIRALGSLVEGVEAQAYDEPPVARVKGSAAMARVLSRAARGAVDTPQAPERLRVVAFNARVELDAADLDRVRQQALGGTAPVNLLRPRARRLLLDALWHKSGAAARRYGDAELAQEARDGFNEDISTEDAFTDFLDAWWPEVTPLQVLRAMADESRLGRWARRLLRPREVRQLARSLRRVTPDGGGLSVHDIALLDELRQLLGTPSRPRERERREADPLDLLTGLEELSTYADRLGPSRRERRERREQEGERADYAHIIVDEAQDLTPMQWRMVGRRGRQATWTIVGDPAQSSWSAPEEAAAEKDGALGTRPRRRFELTVNYRNPAEIAQVADRVLALAMPGTVPPRAVRATGVRPVYEVAVGRDGAPERSPGEAAVRAAAERLLAEVEGTVGVVVAMGRRAQVRGWLAGAGERLLVLGSLEAKGLEYDATLVVSPAEIADESPAGLRVLYVALTRATQRLTVLAGAADDPDGDGVPDLLRET